jgi:hypothetical protein
MRLHPSVTEDEALTWLKEQVAAMQLSAPPANLDETLTKTAEAMAAISSVVLPDEQEPRFP